MKYPKNPKANPGQVLFIPTPTNRQKHQQTPQNQTQSQNQSQNHPQIPDHNPQYKMPDIASSLHRHQPPHPQPNHHQHPQKMIGKNLPIIATIGKNSVGSGILSFLCLSWFKSKSRPPTNIKLKNYCDNYGMDLGMSRGEPEVVAPTHTLNFCKWYKLSLFRSNGGGEVI